jgi:uncharacterized protein
LSLFGIQMEIDLTQLDADGVRVAEAFGPDDLADDAGAGRYEPVRADLAVWLRPEGASVRATGEVTAVIRAECDRCLKPFEVDVAGRFDQRYVWGAPPAGADGESEVEVTELDLERLAGPEFDTRALAREQIDLAAPIRFVCSEGCLGLCPTCRADRNETACDCDVPADPRWDALRDLKKH